MELPLDVVNEISNYLNIFTINNLRLTSKTLYNDKQLRTKVFLYLLPIFDKFNTLYDILSNVRLSRKFHNENHENNFRNKCIACDLLIYHSVSFEGYLAPKKIKHMRKYPFLTSKFNNRDSQQHYYHSLKHHFL